MAALLFKIIKHVSWKWRMFLSIHWPQWWYARWLPAQVQSGPFQGMLYPRHATGSVLLPKLLGSYEMELHPFLNTIEPDQYEQFIDVGAGEGYYAVGLCLRFPKAKMIAFESTKRGQKQIHALAQKNGLADQVSVKGKCETANLKQALEGVHQALLIMDVEGFEAELLDPAKVPDLTRVDFIVEMHPERIPDIVDILKLRFSSTHQLEIIPQQKTRALPKDIHVPKFLADKADYLVNEFRGPQSWLIGKALKNKAL